MWPFNTKQTPVTDATTEPKKRGMYSRDLGPLVPAKHFNVDFPQPTGGAAMDESIAYGNKAAFQEALSFRDKGAPLEALDQNVHRLVWLGFPVFTVALVLGLIWGTRRGEGFDRPEYPLALVTWLAFAGLLVTRTAYGWRGRRSARVTLVGFGAALLVLLVYLARRVWS